MAVLQGDFDLSFFNLTGHAPFRWQRRLFHGYFGRGRIPSALDLPTGLGKTSVMAVWLIARALGCAVPRRLVYGVDRRTVVDQASAEAEMLAERARDALGVRDLAVSTLRGRHLDNRAWMEDPAAPAIVVGTVDMVGSRLLFGGYAVSRGMRPNAAGLIGADTLLVLDEAHLCPPFEALLRTIENNDTLHPEAAVRGLVPPFRLLTLSATGRTDRDDVFRLEPEDREDAVVAQRLDARKHLRLDDLPAGRALEDELAARAVALAGERGRVLVFCNSRDTARKVAARIREDVGKGAEPLLLVGARRVKERDRLVDQLKEAGFLAGSEAPDRPVFLVATSAGEVGMDLDADHMVCDLVSAEPMIQRLGRVNRRGGDGRVARVDVVAAPGEKERPEQAHERLNLWKAPLRALEPAGDGEDEDRRDASPSALRALKDNHGDRVAAATTPEPLHPALTRPLVDAWAMTALDNHPGRPEIAPWLHGWVKDRPQTTVLWRRWLPWRTDGQEKVRDGEPDARVVEGFFKEARPHLSELLEAETDAVVKVLKERARQMKDLPDEAPALIVLSPAREYRRAVTVGALRRGDEKVLDGIERALQGAIAVVSARLGGINADGVLDSTAPGFDLKQPASRWAGCLDAGPGAGPGAGPDAGWDEPFLETIGIRVLGPTETALPEGWKATDRFAWTTGEDEGANTWITVAALRKPGQPGQGGDPAVQRMNQSLAKHSNLTATVAGAIAEKLALPPDCARMLETAARLHDAGKARDCWQRAMNAPRDGTHYAKTEGPVNVRSMTINGTVYRHEFGSLKDAADDAALQALPEDLRDLALHLIASHHGHARPVIPAEDPDLPPSLNRERAQAVALRFARLQRRWGPWGLAWWEALLRAADRMASRCLTGTEEDL